MHALSAPRSDVAIVLNANAKKVTPKVRAMLQARGTGADIYYSNSLEEARIIARKILEIGYPTVLTGGGDGTLVQMINLFYRMTQRLGPDPTRRGEVYTLAEHRSRGGAPRFLPGQMPSVGILRLGTGNAVANVVKAGNYLKDVERIQGLQAAGLELGTRKVALMEAEGQVFPFCGLGWDGAVLNDYIKLKERFTGTPLEGIVKSVVGYIIAAVTQTAPKLMSQPSPVVKVVADEEAFALDPSGRRVRRFAPGETLFEGSANLLCAGTVPFIGAKLKLFPNAGGLDAFELRIVSVTSPEAILNLPRVWFGKYHNDRIHDFHARKVTITSKDPLPYQVGGDGAGERKSLTLGLSPNPLTMVDLGLSRVTRGSLPLINNNDDARRMA